MIKPVLLIFAILAGFAVQDRQSSKEDVIRSASVVQTAD